MAGEIIRQGDPTSHGGKVLEGSAFDLCYGKPISFIGHKVFYPKCKGVFPIIEGVLTTTFYGKGVAIAGMKTGCGAQLIPTQFNAIVEYDGGEASSKASPRNATQNYSVQDENEGGRAEKAGSKSKEPENVNEESFYSLVDSEGNSVEGYKYDIYQDDVLHAQGIKYSNGETIRMSKSKSTRVVSWLDYDGAKRS